MSRPIASRPPRIFWSRAPWARVPRPAAQFSTAPAAPRRAGLLPSAGLPNWAPTTPAARGVDASVPGAPAGRELRLRRAGPPSGDAAETVRTPQALSIRQARTQSPPGATDVPPVRAPPDWAVWPVRSCTVPGIKGDPKLMWWVRGSSRPIRCSLGQNTRRLPCVHLLDQCSPPPRTAESTI